MLPSYTLFMPLVSMEVDVMAVSSTLAIQMVMLLCRLPLVAVQYQLRLVMLARVTPASSSSAAVKSCWLRL